MTCTWFLMAARNSGLVAAVLSDASPLTALLSLPSLFSYESWTLLPVYVFVDGPCILAILASASLWLSNTLAYDQRSWAADGRDVSFTCNTIALDGTDANHTSMKEPSVSRNMTSAGDVVVVLSVTQSAFLNICAIQKKSVNGDAEVKGHAYARTTGIACVVAGHVNHSTVSHDTTWRAESSSVDDHSLQA